MKIPNSSFDVNRFYLRNISSILLDTPFFYTWGMNPLEYPSKKFGTVFFFNQTLLS